MEVKEYIQPGDNRPFTDWANSLDTTTKARILARFARIRNGNPGVHKSVGDGVNELIYTFGAGYRVYYGVNNGTMIILNGGDKSSQEKDIKKAKLFWNEHNEK